MSILQQHRADAVQLHTIDTPSLGDRSYVIVEGDVAVVVDPQRDIDRVLAEVEQLGVRITHVAETHLHNDYVSGGLALAQATGATYLVPADADVSFERHPVGDGDLIEVTPRLTLRVIATPGHTFHHVAYVAESEGKAIGAFTGGSLLYGSVGRPDLVGPEHTDRLAHAQFASVHRLVHLLPEDTAVYPTHGFGSFCSATQATGDRSTIGIEQQGNPALTQQEEEFVRSLLAGLDEYPAYYAHMSAANAEGPPAADLSLPEPVDAGELRQRIERGEWVVDLRHRLAFAAGHVAGTFNFGVDGNLATYLGWLIPWGSPLTLVGDSVDQVAEAQRELVRIGIDRPAGAAIGSPDELSGGKPLRSYRLARFAELARTRHDPNVVILDVRRKPEWEQSYISGAIHIPLHELAPRLSELPPGEIWVHCAGGYRASIAGSLLDAAGRQVVVVDDDYEAHAAAAGLTTGPSDAVDRS